MADEYIKKSDALNAMEWKWAGEAAFKAVKEIPPADVTEVKHGMWQILAPYNNMNRPRCRCTNCGLTHVFPDFYSIQYNFCPECGADMRKDGE